MSTSSSHIQIIASVTCAHDVGGTASTVGPPNGLTPASARTGECALPCSSSFRGVAGLSGTSGQRPYRCPAPQGPTVTRNCISLSAASPRILCLDAAIPESRSCLRRGSQRRMMEKRVTFDPQVDEQRLTSRGDSCRGCRWLCRLRESPASDLKLGGLPNDQCDACNQWFLRCGHWQPRPEIVWKPSPARDAMHENSRSMALMRAAALQYQARGTSADVVAGPCTRRLGYSVRLAPHSVST